MLKLTIASTAAITNGELLWPKKDFDSIPQHPSKILVPCYDLAGTVVTPVANSPFKPGDQVWALTDFSRTGVAAEYTTALESELALRSQHLSWAESATVPMSALTAWQALFAQAGFEAKGGSLSGKKILVTAGSGSVGRWVVQLATWAGATVIATCGTHNVSILKSLGVKIVLDYHIVDIKQWIQYNSNNKVDLAIDCIGGSSLADAWRVIKKDGTLISIAQNPKELKPNEIDDSSIRNLFFIVKPNGPQLMEITKMIDAGLLAPCLDSSWPLEKFDEALAKLATGKTSGKIVFDMGVKGQEVNSLEN
jgi:NADPH:quinone reductase-like Zn-dependent oxidoreductase